MSASRLVRASVVVVVCLAPTACFPALGDLPEATRVSPEAGANSDGGPDGQTSDSGEQPASSGSGAAAHAPGTASGAGKAGAPEDATGAGADGSGTGGTGAAGSAGRTVESGAGGGSGSGGLSGAGQAGSGGAASVAGGAAPRDALPSCASWVHVANIEQAKRVPDAWHAGQERVPDVQTFTQHVCRARPDDAGSSTGVGKGVFGYGCYVPMGPAEINIRLEVDVLVAPPGNTCLQWRSLEAGALPANALRLEGTPVCQAHYNGETVFDGKFSDGEHVGQLIEDGSGYTCVFGFYMNAVDEGSELKVLVGP